MEAISSLSSANCNVPTCVNPACLLPTRPMILSCRLKCLISMETKARVGSLIGPLSILFLWMSSWILYRLELCKIFLQVCVRPFRIAALSLSVNLRKIQIMRVAGSSYCFCQECSFGHTLELVQLWQEGLYIKGSCSSIGMS